MTALVQLPVPPAKRVTPHVLWHTNAMLLHARDIDILTIALCLATRAPRRPMIYLHADEAQTASDQTYHPDRHPPGRYKPPDALLAFLAFLDGL